MIGTERCVVVHGRRSHHLWVLMAVVAMAPLVASSYWDQRESFLKEEASWAVGGLINLTAEEEMVNGILMEAKRKELAEAFNGTNTFLPSRHFFEAKADMEKSDVFRFIKDLPKGAVLHGHDSSMVSLGYLVTNLTHRENLYACVVGNTADLTLKRMQFTDGEPPSSDGDCEWTAMDELRKSHGTEFIDHWLSRELSLVTDNPWEKYPTVDIVWDYFNQLFERISGLINYKPVFEDYYKQVLTELRDDNIIYLEIRGTLSKLYDLEGNQWEGSDVAKILKEATEEFVSKNPEDFFGAKLIYGPIRHINDSTFTDDLQMVMNLHAQYPDFLAGFDLVGQEDKGRPLKDFVDRLLTLPPDIQFFFHAGETNWQGLTDMNLVDAILLNTTRIGHGYALLKHPLVVHRARERGIAVEVNPISNQVLRLVDDLRNHPAAALLADEFPVVISCDDPCFWNASGLSYDFYEAFMGFAGAEADLRLLKQLSVNSILYSSMQGDEKNRAMNLWQKKWNQFIEKTIRKHQIDLGIFTNEVK
ncbi:adenosine deaminase 2-like [Hetaerina americana]|uniref:adenosine deaminase 2-like n=1 Tax=Hetaerina americana TaxID=62018 RepID=UPI003A7F30A8